MISGSDILLSLLPSRHALVRALSERVLAIVESHEPNFGPRTHGLYRPAGKANAKVLPSPGSLVTHIRPP